MSKTRALILLLTICWSTGCVSVRQSTKNLNTLRDPDRLKSDVDYVYARLQKYHPRLYEYTRKDVLDYKFDSLKSSMVEPMTSNDFFFRLSPVVAAVRQGHALLKPMEPRIGMKESFKQEVWGGSPLFRYGFEIFDNRLYITENLKEGPFFKPGTEVVSINGCNPVELISKFTPAVASDGYIQTYVPRKLSHHFPYYFYLEKGITDSVVCEIRVNDTIDTVHLTRDIPSLSRENLKTRDQRKAERPQQQSKREKRDEQGYNALSNKFSKELTFTDADSSIAFLAVRDFTNGNYPEYYNKCFRLLDSLKTKTLILDLRDNLGGDARDATCLLSWLVDTSFAYLDKSEVASKYSIVKSNYFIGNPLLVNMILSIAYPMHLMSNGILLLLVQKDADNKYWLTVPESWTQQPKNNNFKGSLYVIINGGTFSAASILASNLKGLNRAVLVGEETGGTALGTVAGKMAAFRLPASKLYFTFGLAHMQPHYRAGLEGRGVFPDIEIKPTLQDRIDGKDPELEWILNRVKTAANSVNL